MNDYDRYDFILSWVMGIVVVGAFLLGAPLWALMIICMVGCTISLHRHRLIPPRSR
jgi:hypothetical protein